MAGRMAVAATYGLAPQGTTIEWPPRWRIGFGTTGGTVMGEATSWDSLQLNLRLTHPCDASLTCWGDSLAPGLVVELETDMWLWRGGTLMFRGRVTTVDDTLSDGGHRIAIRATDYRGLLDRRVLLPGDVLKFKQVDQADIAWFLVNQAQGHGSGNLGITRGIAQLGYKRDREYDRGQSIGELLDNLSDVLFGIEYNVDPTLKFNVWYPHRGQDTKALLDFGGSITSVERRSSSANFANYVRHTGGGKTVAAQAFTADLATGAPQGRWDVVVSDPDLHVQATVQNRAERVLADRQSRPDQYNLTISPGHWAGLGLGVGDWARLVARYGAFELDERVRIHEVAYDVGVDGEYTTKLATVRDPS